MKKIIIILLVISSFIFSQTSERQGFKIKREIKPVENFEKKRVIKFSVINNNEEKYSIKKTIISKEVIPEVFLFSNGAAVLSNVLRGKVEIYNNSGILKNTIDIFRNLPFEYERSVLLDTSENYCVIVSCQQNIDKCEVNIFDNEGNVLSSFEINDSHSNGIKISKQLNFLALSTYKWNNNKLINNTTFYNFDGSVFFTTSLSFEKGKFLVDSGKFVGFENHQVFISDLQKRSLEFKRNITNDLNILVADLINGKIYLALSANPLLEDGKWIYNSLEIKIINIKDKLELTKTINIKPFAKLRFIQKESKLLLKTENQLLLLEKVK